MSKIKGSGDNIRVFVRVRPTNAQEVKSRSVIDVPSGTEIVVRENKQNDSTKTFTFNETFGPLSSQVDVYRSVVHPLIGEVLSGFQCTVFAYGQTGTGKTFTMEGEHSPDCLGSWESDPLAGIIPRTLSNLFDELRAMEVEFAVRVSFLELYNEELFDLLSPDDDTTKLRIFEDSAKKGSVIISGLEEVAVHSKADVYSVLEKGSHKRQTAATLMNAHSSRSHTVFTVTVHIRDTSSEGEDVMRTGKINLVDLAGSENIGRSGAIDKRAREAGNINQSLLTLGRVITALVEHSPHIPYRESKLTRLLQESLGGRTKTSIIATVSPALSNIEETLSTLDYAHRAKNIQNKPEVNQHSCKKTLLKEFSAEIERLQRDLEATTQCKGVYLDHTEHEGMIVQLDQLQTEVAQKNEYLLALQDQIDKKMAICNELFTKKEALETECEKQISAKQSQEATFAAISNETSKLSSEMCERDYLLINHVETNKVLSDQAKDIFNTAQNSVGNATYLFGKLDRTRGVSSQNGNAVNSVKSDFTSRFSFAEKEFEDKAQAVEKNSLAFPSTIKGAREDCLQPIRNVNHLMDRLCDDQALVIKDLEVSSNALRARDDTLKDALMSGYSSRNVASDLGQRQLEMSGSDFLKQNVALTARQEDISQVKSDILHGDEQQKKLVMGVVKSQEVVKEDMIGKVTKEFRILSDGMEEHRKSDEGLRARYNQNQKDMINKIAIARAALTDVLVLQKDTEALVESAKESSHQWWFELKSCIESACALAAFGVESQNQSITNVQKQFKEQTRETMEKVLISLQQSPPLPNVDEVEERTLHQIRDLSSSWNNVQGSICSLLQASTEHCNFSAKIEIEDENKLTSDSPDEELEGNLKETVTHVKNELHMHNSLVNKLSEDLSLSLRHINEHLKPIISIKSEIEACNELVLKFAADGLQTVVSTGATPQRSNLNISRDLAATSPRERIIARLREKYGEVNCSDMEEEEQSVVNSPDGFDSDSGWSDHSDSLHCTPQENKENPSIHDKDKKTNNSCCRVKKPLVAKN